MLPPYLVWIASPGAPPPIEMTLILASRYAAVKHKATALTISNGQGLPGTGTLPLVDAFRKGG
jgi:hypothetical protein